MINLFSKNSLNQTVMCTMDNEFSLSVNYYGPVRGKRSPKLIEKYFPLCGIVKNVCEKCEFPEPFCLCSDEIRDVKLTDSLGTQEDSKLPQIGEIWECRNGEVIGKLEGFIGKGLCLFDPKNLKSYMKNGSWMFGEVSNSDLIRKIK